MIAIANWVRNASAAPPSTDIVALAKDARRVPGVTTGNRGAAMVIAGGAIPGHDAR